MAKEEFVEMRGRVIELPFDATHRVDPAPHDLAKGRIGCRFE